MEKYHTRFGYPSPLFELQGSGMYVGGETSSFQSWLEASVNSGSTQSGVVDLGDGYHAVGLFVPGNISGSTLSFLVGYDESNLGLLQDDSGLIQYPIIANAVVLDVKTFYPWRYLKFRVSSAPSVASAIKVRRSTI